jgi:Domain of unknown function (DUF5658)
MPSRALVRPSAHAIVDRMFGFFGGSGRGGAHRSPARAGTIALAAFAFVQCADGWLTMAGIARFGPAIEANPLLAFYVAVFGAGAIIAAKVIAVACAAVLHVHAHGVVLVVLTLAYIAFAVLPWLCVFGA